MTDLFVLAYAGVVGFVLGVLSGFLLAQRDARRSPICPTCFGPTDERGTSEAWGWKR